MLLARKLIRPSQIKGKLSLTHRNIHCELQANNPGHNLTARHHAPLPPPAWFKSSRYSTRVGGMTSWSRRQLRLASPGQSRNCKSLDRHSRTSVKRLRAQPIAIARGDRPELALMNASSTSRGVTLSGSRTSV